MALVNCNACGNQISTDAVACPSCGHPGQLYAGGGFEAVRLQVVNAIEHDVVSHLRWRFWFAFVVVAAFGFFGGGLYIDKITLEEVEKEIAQPVRAMESVVDGAERQIEQVETTITAANEQLAAAQDAVISLAALEKSLREKVEPLDNEIAALRGAISATEDERSQVAAMQEQIGELAEATSALLARAEEERAQVAELGENTGNIPAPVHEWQGLDFAFNSVEKMTKFDQYASAWFDNPKIYDPKLREITVLIVGGNPKMVEALMEVLLRYGFNASYDANVEPFHPLLLQPRINRYERTLIYLPLHAEPTITSLILTLANAALAGAGAEAVPRDEWVADVRINEDAFYVSLPLVW